MGLGLGLELLAQRTQPASTVPHCNCRAKTSCPMKGQCRESSIIYKATLTTDGIAKNYYSCSETEFKTRFYNYNQSFRYRQKSNATELSKAFWKAKDTGKNPFIEWSIATRTTPYRPGARWCNLCLAEKRFILRADPTTMLNKRSELNRKCRHKNKFKLKKFLVIIRGFTYFNIRIILCLNQSTTIKPTTLYKRSKLTGKTWPQEQIQIN